MFLRRLNFDDDNIFALTYKINSNIIMYKINHIVLLGRYSVKWYNMYVDNGERVYV